LDVNITDWMSISQASAFMVFPTVEAACEAANVLRKETGVDAVEMFDPSCLRECKSNDGMVKWVATSISSQLLNSSSL
jgi:hypothetical protein